MPNMQIDQLKPLEGRRVSLALRDGSRIDNCQLISAGRAKLRSVWVFTNGLDLFISYDDLIDVWEMRPRGTSQAA